MRRLQCFLGLESKQPNPTRASFVFCHVHDMPISESPTIAFDADAKTFVNSRSKVLYKGITRVLARSFYRQYTPAKRWRRWPRGRNKKKKKTQSGLVRGRCIDRQIGRHVRASRLACTLCINRQKGLGCAPPAPTRTRELDPFARAVCAKLRDMGLIPIAAQVVVSSRSLNLATAVDIVCRNALREYVLIEVKSGFEHSLHDSNGCLLQPPFDSIGKNACPLNQFHLQLLLTSLLFRETFPHCTNLGWPQIMITNERGCSVVPLAEWAVKLSAKMLLYLS
jgi:hypothetical protein